MDSQRLAAAKSADLLALIGHDTELVRIAGTLGGEWAGPCPFCGGSDRLHVNPARPGGGRWYCRQCTPRGGDAIDYVRRRDHLCFGEAIARLADHAIISPPVFGQWASARHGPHSHVWQEPGWQQAARRQVQRAVLALAGEEGQASRAYLAGRGLDSATWQAWRLGYTPPGIRAGEPNCPPSRCRGRSRVSSRPCSTASYPDRWSANLVIAS